MEYAPAGFDFAFLSKCCFAFLKLMAELSSGEVGNMRALLVDHFAETVDVQP